MRELITDNENDGRGRVAAISGRHLVVLREGAQESACRALSRKAGIRCMRASDCGPRVDFCALPAGEAVVFESLGVALIDAPLDQIGSARFDEHGPFLSPERERIWRLIERPSLPVSSFAQAETGHTWGLVATRADRSQYTGADTRVCVLDSGIDQNHPDFSARDIETKCFTGDGIAHDTRGHGTHCAGIVCGPRVPHEGPRYGVASDARLMVGKVVDDDNDSCDGRVLAGIEWAVAAGCNVVAMSFGLPVGRDERHSPTYEWAARRALDRGTLLIAAAGNESRRDSDILEPVNHPANCPSVMAVAALDPRLGISFLSNGGLNDDGGQIDLAAPGADVRSAWTGKARYSTEGGTSVAVPFVAGVALLYAQAMSERCGRALQSLLLQNARRLPLPSRDVGMGLVQAP